MPDEATLAGRRAVVASGFKSTIYAEPIMAGCYDHWQSVQFAIAGAREALKVEAPILAPVTQQETTVGQ